LQAGVDGGKSAQPGFVTVAQIFHMPQHQRGDAVATGQLNLRNGLFRVQAGDECAQRQQHVADMRRQHWAAFHVSHVAAFALMKAHQHLAFFAHIAHRQARPVAVAPGRTFNGAHQVVGFDFADVLKVVFKHPLLDRDLRGDVQMLHFAAAARARVQAKVGAARRDALRRFTVNLHHHGFFKRRFFAVHIGRDQLVWQRTFNEHHLAISAVGDALCVDV